MADWRITFEDPNDPTMEVEVPFPRPLRQDEIAKYAVGTFGKPAKILHRDPYPGTTRQFQEVFAGKETAEPERYPREGWQERLKAEAPEVAGFVASTAVGAGLPGVLGKMATPLVAKGVLPNLPRLGQFLGLTGSGAAAGATQPLVAGRPEDMEMGAYTGTVLGGLGGAMASGKGAASRVAPGGPGRAGEAMARDIERVGSVQVPPLKGQTTAGSLYDWATSTAGQEGLNQMYGAMKQEIGDAVRAAATTPTGYRAHIAKKLGVKLGALNIPAISPKPISFEMALEKLKTLGRSFEAPASAQGVQEQRWAWMDGTDQLYSEFKRLKIPPETQAKLAEVKAQYAKALAYRILLEDSFTQRELAPVLVQRALKDNRREIEKLMGWMKEPSAYNALTDVVLRGKLGKPHPVTGAREPAVGMTDIPGLGFSRHFRGYAIQGPTGLPTKFRLGTALPNQPWWTKYQAAPGRLPLEMKPENVDLLNKLMQLGRAGVQYGPASEP